MRSTKKLLEALGVTLVAVTSGPAIAQGYGAPPAPPPPATPPRGEDGETPPTPPPPTALPEVLRATACAVQRDTAPALALLGTAPFSPEERTQAGAFLRNAQRCLRQREPIVTSALNARWAIAETLYEIQFATPVAARTPALGAAPLTRPGTGLDAESQAVLTPMFALVECSTPRQPDLVRAVLATEPRSAEETAAMTALTPTYHACVTPGTQLRIDPRVMRAFFAEQLYRWSVVQRDGATSPWAAAPAPATPSGS